SPRRARPRPSPRTRWPSRTSRTTPARRRTSRSSTPNGKRATPRRRPRSPRTAPARRASTSSLRAVDSLDRVPLPRQRGGPMLKFYYSPRSSASRVHVAIEELGVPYEKIRVHLEPGKEEQKKPEFLAINPNGKIPALVDGDAKVFESLACI